MKNKFLFIVISGKGQLEAAKNDLIQQQKQRRR